MWRAALAVSVAGAILGMPAVAGSTVGLTAVGTRVGDHPAFVRAVVDFTDGRLDAGPIMAVDPDPFADGRVRIVVPGRHAQAQAPPVRREGLTVRVTRGRDRVVVLVEAARRRFKYAGYQVFHAGERLVVDFFKSAPPGSGAVARYGRPGCLAFTTLAVRPAAIRATGRERDIFEHSFPLRVRSAAGRVVGTRVVTAARGRWRARVGYRVARPQTGTLEAVDLSAKDGALTCLTQTPVALRP